LSELLIDEFQQLEITIKSIDKAERPVIN
jgi:hypothetical protein